ncbi:hypothetical protein ISP15_13405 [Dyella jejuensis]|uniref:Uncharacterized protein n=1 Tax=Dyella jejuensis TaxID=1432009 RepID=A0ABW8JJR6_9GAMM
MKKPPVEKGHAPTWAPGEVHSHAAASTQAAASGSSLSYFVHVFFFASWVAICSAAPELIWQGFLTALHHFDWITVGSALLVGAIVAFFVEPLTERLRAGSINLTHKHKTTTHATFTAFGFAVLAVLVHDAITTYVATTYAGHQAKDNLVYAITEVSQWAWIPFFITIAWMFAREARWAAIPVLLLALVAIVAVGFAFDWYAIDIFTTTIPCAAILFGGFYVMRWHADPKALMRCTTITAAIAIAWLASMGLLQAIFSLFAVKSLRVYTWGEYAIDCRFYLGWVIGLVIAPSPTAHHLSKTHS